MRRARRHDQELAELRDRVDSLATITGDLAIVVRSLSQAVETLAGDFATTLVRIEELEQLAATPAPAVLDIPPAATYDGEQHHDEPAAEPAAPELTEKQQALVAAVNELREASTGDIARHVGRADQGDAVSMALQKLRRMGLVGHNGRRAKGARWLAVTPGANATADTPAPAAAEPLEVTPLDDRIVALVHEHGPVTSVWVADQLVKNRRDTGARMRELARNGHLVDLDGAFATPDHLEDAA